MYDQLFMQYAKLKQFLLRAANGNLNVTPRQLYRFLLKGLVIVLLSDESFGPFLVFYASIGQCSSESFISLTPGVQN